MNEEGFRTYSGVTPSAQFDHDLIRPSKGQTTIQSPTMFLTDIKSISSQGRSRLLTYIVLAIKLSISFCNISNSSYLFNNLHMTTSTNMTCLMRFDKLN